MNALDVILWQFLALLACVAVICGLLVFVFDQRDEVRQSRDRAAEERGAARAARREAARLHAQIEQRDAALNQARLDYEGLADEFAAQQLVLETFVPDNPGSLEDRT